MTLPPCLPVVLVHGFIGHLRFAELAEAGLVLAPDLLGYGEHRLYPAPALSVRGQVDHLVRAIDAWVGERPVVLVAHSAGATVAIRLAQLFPQRVAGLLIAEGNLSASDAFLAARLGPMSLPQVQAWLEQMRADPARLLLADRVPITDTTLMRMRDWLDHQGADVLHQMARSVLLESVTPNYAMAVAAVMRKVPTALVFGARSAHKRMLAEPLRSALVESIVMEDAGHLLPLEAPARFRRHIDAFARTVGQMAPPERVS